MVNEDIARGMVCFFHQKKHSYLIILFFKDPIKVSGTNPWCCRVIIEKNILKASKEFWQKKLLKAKNVWTGYQINYV
jgi:hypothetical protein